MGIRLDGGTAIISRHLAAMGARPTLLTPLPRTTEAEALRRRLNADGVETHWIELDQLMIEKQRLLVGTTKVMKLDLGGPLTLDAAHQTQFIQQAAEAAPNSQYNSSD
jgi:bifunctional ADP-heptose synthase (sugar kinase/adenylyltransferase)